MRPRARDIGSGGWGDGAVNFKTHSLGWQQRIVETALPLALTLPLVRWAFADAVWRIVTDKKTTSKKALARSASTSTGKSHTDSGGARFFHGRAREDGAAILPAPPPKSDLPSGYAETLGELKARIRQARVRVVLAANASVILLYWDIGHTILERQAREGWGAKVIDRFSHDLREEFPDMEGLSPRNLRFMRSFAQAYPDVEIVKQLVSQLPWGHVIKLLQSVKDADVRHWYMRQAIEHVWSREILTEQIERKLHARQGKMQSNFELTLPADNIELAAQAFRDPYIFDFLGTADSRREREVEQALIDHIERFLLELGAGFAFVGRQMQLEVGDQDFKLDLLFYHLKLRCFVVVELKAVPFEPAFVGQLNLYLSAVDDLMKHTSDQPTIGLLLCRGKNKFVVEYALRHLDRPVGVAEWETVLIEKLPKALEGSLPTIEQIEAELAPKTQKAKKS
jgi:predicted nuclease of restriction endonuclease-like (RecB) superfamily